MNMNSRMLFRIGAVSALVLVAAIGLVQSAEQVTPEKARLKKLDDGRRTIDTAKYPAEQQEAYALLSKKCIKCHSLGRVVNTTFVLPDQWERYIKRMMNKPDSKLSEQNGKSIYRFLVYDSSVRKADSLRVHLAVLPAGERDEAIEKIRALNPAFGPGK